MDNRQQGVKDKKKDPAKNKGTQGGAQRGEAPPERDLECSLEEESVTDSLPTKT